MAIFFVDNNWLVSLRVNPSPRSHLYLLREAIGSPKSNVRRSLSFRVARRLTAPTRVLHPFLEPDAPSDKWSHIHLENLNG
jgi:hypothetical protein